MRNARWFGAGVVVAGVAGLAVVAAGQQAQPGMSAARFWVANKARAEAVPVTLVAIDREQPAPVLDVRTERLPPVDLTPATITDVARAVRARAVWEYREIIADSTANRQQALTNAGAEGWEAVSAVADADGRIRVLLKRPR